VFSPLIIQKTRKSELRETNLLGKFGSLKKEKRVKKKRIDEHEQKRRKGGIFTILAKKSD